MVKNPPAMREDLGSIPGLGRNHGEGNSYPLQYSGLESSMDMGGWQATVHGVAEWDMTEQLSVSLVAVRRLLIPMASVVAEHGL